MTEKKIALVKNEAIGRLAYEMGLHNWIILSKNAEQKQAQQIANTETCLSNISIVNLPVTCIGPIIDAAKTARLSDKPRSPSMGSI